MRAAKLSRRAAWAANGIEVTTCRVKNLYPVPAIPFCHEQPAISRDCQVGRLVERESNGGRSLPGHLPDPHESFALQIGLYHEVSAVVAEIEVFCATLPMPGQPVAGRGEFRAE